MPTATTTTNPVQIMDWRSRLAEGNTTAATRTVAPEETAAHQLNQLTAGGSQYVKQAEDRARNEASARGMMMSTAAAGAGRRAAIDAAAPIATHDADTFARTASENMAATNTDRLADQQTWGQLTNQEVGIRANLDEAEQARSWQTGERVGAQQFTGQQNQLQREWQGAQNNSQRQHELSLEESRIAHDSTMRALDRSTSMTQLDKQLTQQRFAQFDTSVQSMNKQLSDTIASIYSNPNLSSTQQAAAVQNARAVYQSMYNSWASAMSAGVPQIYMQPYQMSTRTIPSQTTVPPVRTGTPAPTPVRQPSNFARIGGSLFGGRTGAR